MIVGLSDSDMCFAMTFPEFYEWTQNITGEQTSHLDAAKGKASLGCSCITSRE